MIVGVIGLGDVGQAINKLCSQKHQVFGRDLDKDNLAGKKIDILHICIPWSKKFDLSVKTAIKELKPKVTIISSTVKPGTTQAIASATKTDLVHAPVIGIHPHLYEHMKVFTKPLGATSNRAFKLAKDHFEELGVTTTKFDSPFNTELAKILSTTYYAWNILYEKWVYRLSQEHQANFDQLYTKWNQIYNSGYQNSKPNVIRPVLKHSSGPIGGHCLIPNAKILNDWLNDTFTNFIIENNN